MDNKNNIPDKLENSAPFLAKIKKENHFSIPKDYFESLPEIISNKKLNNSILKNIFDKLSWRILVPISSLAVVLLIILNLNRNEQKKELTSEQLSDIIINEEYTKIDNYLVEDAYAEILEEEENKKTMNTKTTETDEYIDYLIENDIDINVIIDEL